MFLRYRNSSFRLAFSGELDPFMGVARPRARFSQRCRKNRHAIPSCRTNILYFFGFLHLHAFCACLCLHLSVPGLHGQASVLRREEPAGDIKREQETNRLSILLCIFLSAHLLDFFRLHVQANGLEKRRASRRYEL